MFAEFELKIHELVDAGEALSGARMTELYEQLVRQYHGSDEGVLTYDPAYAVEWAFIPHFYRNFYVFQYATSIAGGTMFAERFLDGDDQARDDYLAVLSAGGSRYAYELLQEYGIDLVTDAPVRRPDCPDGPGDGRDRVDPGPTVESWVGSRRGDADARSRDAQGRRRREHGHATALVDPIWHRRTESRSENRIGPRNEGTACRHIEGRPLRFSSLRLRLDAPAFHSRVLEHRGD